LLDAFRAARSEKHAAVIARTKPDPAGGRWVAEGDEFAQDRTVRMTDKRAAADPLRQQLQMAIRSMAAEMIDPTVRLSNSRTWGRLSATAAAFHVVMEGDPLRMPERLGDAYALLLRLGRFLETDIRVQRDSAAFDDPLDADIHGLLTDLVRTAAPWLRGFPTVAAWDDAAGKAWCGRICSNRPESSLALPVRSWPSPSMTRPRWNCWPMPLMPATTRARKLATGPLPAQRI
jgi:hypothetical protein